MFNDMCRYNISDEDCDKCLKHKGFSCPLPCPDFEHISKKKNVGNFDKLDKHISGKDKE